MLLFSCAYKCFIGALIFVSGDTLVMTAWHYRSYNTCSLIPYAVHCSAQPPADGGCLKNLPGGYAEAGLGVHQLLVYRSCRLNKVFGEPSLLSSATTTSAIFDLVLCVSHGMNSGDGG